ncbi:hypothetical protein EB796_016294 [Bugula neritina]|uniref:Protein sleepless n=1 Tax=Bugula neritina TaxID=10212 RepID=A0A7J7JHW0_BUGNE|nr:hypothetical protein EB796_016294 [Bugula neritina]
MEWHVTNIFLVLLLHCIMSTEATINCYVCDTTDMNNEIPEVCDDTFLLNRGATIEKGCAACVKEKIFSSGFMIIKRSCERSLRWQSSVWSCNRNQDTEYVFGLSGTRCTCLTDLCNGAPSLKGSMLPMLTFLILCIRALL